LQTGVQFIFLASLTEFQHSQPIIPLGFEGFFILVGHSFVIFEEHLLFLRKLSYTSAKLSLLSFGFSQTFIDR